MIVTTTNSIEGYTIRKYLGVVNANVVIGTNLFSDIAASLTGCRDLVLSLTSLQMQFLLQGPKSIGIFRLLYVN